MHKVLVVLSLVVSCKGGEKEKNQIPPPPDPGAAARAAEKAEPPPPPPRKELTPEEMGSCKLTATGAVKAEQTSPGGKNATNVSAWYSESERKINIGVDGFFLACRGTDIIFELTPDKKGAQIFAPKKYTVESGKGDVAVYVRFGPKEMEKITGTIDITDFDHHHIAGTIALSGTIKQGGGAQKLTGEFDLICPNFAECE